jgi:DNA topoisomerase-1
VCGNCYVHPAVIYAYLDGKLVRGALRARVEGELKNALAGLSPEEAAVLVFLQQWLSKGSEPVTAAPRTLPG